MDKQEHCYVPLDIFDNSETKKEGIGYAPIFAYLGLEGYAVNGELRGGSVHSQNGAVEFIRGSVGYARTDAKLLLRVDSGHDSCDTLNVCPGARHRLHRQAETAPQAPRAVAGDCQGTRHGMAKSDPARRCTGGSGR
ncbi:MAG: hypothetical protein M0Z66_07650 [Thermaerobacter sp.]|nr:hypothetical protein [Thermaerobacter sp.]